MHSDAQQWPLLWADGLKWAKHEAWFHELVQCQHDPTAWQVAFCQAGDGTRNPDMEAIRALRKLVWCQTERVIDCLLQGARVPYDSLQPYCLADPAPRTECVRARTLLEDDSLLACEVRVLNMDMLQVARSLVEQGSAVAVLNMASASHPGGGYRQGRGAQEENFHRRSDLARFTVGQKCENYPIPKDACLLSRRVTIFRGPEDEGYPFQAPCQVSVVSCAAVRKPKLNSERQYASGGAFEAMRTRIALILDAAVCAECNAVVLSAFGCGAFGNPPEIVAKLFRMELARSPLRLAVFCIRDDHNASHSHNPRGNVRPFEEVFGL